MEKMNTLNNSHQENSQACYRDEVFLYKKEKFILLQLHRSPKRDSSLRVKRESGENPEQYLLL